MKRPLVLVTAAATSAILAVPALAAPHRTVELRDNFFSPARLTVTRGTTITWAWKGVAPHNVTVITGPRRFRSGLKMPGSTYRRRLTRAGVYRINCTIHPTMTQTIRVR
jgi:plastocyanin